MLDGTGRQLVDLHRVGPIIFDGDSELGSLDPEGGVLGDQDGVAPGIVQIETAGEDPVIGRRGVEHRRQPIRHDAVELDSQ